MADHTLTKAPAERTKVKRLLPAPQPTRGTLFWRTFLPWQLWRFIAINLQMIRMMRLEHKKSMHRKGEPRGG